MIKKAQVDRLFSAPNTVAGTRPREVRRHQIPLENVPVDFFADPDGQWSFEELVQLAGFSLDQGVAVGALTRPFEGHPEGSAVVTLNAASRPYVAIVDAVIVEEVVGDWSRLDWGAGVA